MTFILCAMIGVRMPCHPLSLPTFCVDPASLFGSLRLCRCQVCTTSPQVEQNVRALARDLQKPERWTKALFSGEVQYRVSV
jgi:hypothetical protein